jgi:hypothetical protein
LLPWRIAHQARDTAFDTGKSSGQLIESIGGHGMEWST